MVVIFSPPCDGLAKRDVPQKHMIKQWVVTHKKGADSRYNAPGRMDADMPHPCGYRLIDHIKPPTLLASLLPHDTDTVTARDAREYWSCNDGMREVHMSAR